MKVEKRTDKDRALVLFGPTAVGKTGLTKELFSSGYEIINADSIQVYKGLDIASAKPDKDLMSLIPHHLVDILDPREEFSAGDFCSLSSSLIKEINERGHIPLITGGTAYYFKMLCYKRNPTPKADPAVRDRVKRILEEKGLDELRNELERVDDISFNRIYKEDVYRLTRALEVYYQTGRPLSSFSLLDSLRDDVEFILIGLERDKSELEARIVQRVEEMFSLGAVDEMKRLIENGADKSWPSMEAIGYREWFDALETGEYSVRGVKERIKHNSVKYAKRQMTFFRSFKDTHWFHPDDREGIKALLSSRWGCR